MKKLLILFLLLFPSMSFGAAYTSTQTGNWNAVATWGGGGSPIAGDTVTIATTHIVTVTATAACGTGGATGTDELTIVGTLIVGDFTLTIDGDTQINNGTLQLNAGAIVSIDGTYEIEYTGTAALDINGTSGNRCEISAISGQGTWFDTAANSSVLNVDADYCDFIRFTGGSNSWNFEGEGSTQDVSFTNCLFDDMDAMYLYSHYPSTSSTMQFTNCDFRNLPSGFGVIFGTGGTYSFGADTHFFKNCTLVGNSGLTTVLVRMGASTNPVVFEDVVSEDVEWSTQSPFTADGGASYQHDGSDTVFQVTVTPTGSAIVKNFLAWGDFTNMHFFVSQGTGGALFQDNISFCEESLGNGNHYLPTEASNTTTIERCITVGDNAVVLRSAATPITNVYRHTHITSESNDDAMVFIESPGYTGTFTFHSSLEYSLSPNDMQLFDDIITSAGLNAGSSMDFNGIYDHTFSTRYNVVMSGKTLGDTGFGESDISDDPGLKNESATFQTWDTSLGGGGTVINAFGELLKVNGYDRSGDPATYDTDYSLDNALAYFRDAFTPTNSALAGAGDSGVDIGAIDVVSVAVSLSQQIIFF